MASINGATRRVERVLTAIRTLEGEGFEVRRAIPAGNLPAVGPFIFLDHFGPVEYGPGEAKGAPNHPHCGFETLTYLLEGSAIHRDSLGNISTIGAGEAQWMRAGSGIMHDEGADEALRRDGGRYQGVQFWINLPKGRKMSPPEYRAISASEIVDMQLGASSLRLLAGNLGDAAGPIETWANPWLGLVETPLGSSLTLDPEAMELAVYVLSGQIEIGGRTEAEGQLALLGAGTDISVYASQDSRYFFLGGDPLDAPLRRYGPFVMNTDEDLHDAVRDYQAGRFGTIPFCAL